jgi:hypothetical protein
MRNERGVVGLLPAAILLAASLLSGCSQAAPRHSVRLDDGWRSILGDPVGAQAADLDDSGWQRVSVPHNWEDYQGYRKLSHGNLHGTAWYRRTFTPDLVNAGQRHFLEFEGVGSYAKVWINGHLVGEHNGGRTSFSCDVTDYLQFGRPNVIAVRADHPAMIQDLPYVCGGCWGSPNTEGSQPLGIFRPVHLVVTDPVRVEPFGVHVWTPEISSDRAVVKVETEVKNYGPTRQVITVRNEILGADGAVLETMEKEVDIRAGETVVVGQLSPPLQRPHLWSLDDPYLHSMRTTLLVGGKPVDSVETRFGLRWIEWPVGSVGQAAVERTLDPAKLKEEPSPANNFFTVEAGGRKDSKVRVQPGGVQVFIPSCTADSATVRVKTTVKNDDDKAHTIRLTSFIRNYDGTKFVYSMDADRELAPGETYTFDQTSPVIHFPELWSPEKPYLHVMETTLQDPAQAWTKRAIVYDRAETPFGIRSVEGLANKGSAYVASEKPMPTDTASSGQFLLNGKPVFINGTCEYEHLLGGDHAFSDEQIRARMMQIKAAGFNAFRDAHHPHNLRYLELCDELGLLCWTQVGAHIYFDNEAFRDNYRQAVREWVRERRNSPSVVLWSLQNESRLPEVFARELTEIVRELDPTTSDQRKTVTCNGGVGSDWDIPQNWLGTYRGNVNSYGQEIVQQRLVGEYGQYRTLGLHQDGDWAQNWAAGQMLGRDIPEELFDYCLETRVRMAEENRSKICGQFQWIFSTHANPGRSETDCRDGLGLNAVGVVNYKGLLTSWGEPVDAYYMYRANYAPCDSQPMVYIVSHTWPDRFDGPGTKSAIVVFSNCDEVELFNDYQAESLGTRKRGPIGTHFQWDDVEVRYNVLYAEGRIGGKTVATDIIVLNNLPVAPAWQRHADADADDTAAAQGAEYLYRVNCGGEDYTDVHGQQWQADTNWSSWAEAYDNLDPRYASLRRTHDPIAGTKDDLLLQTYRYGRQKLKYRFAVPNGRYLVELYFIEPWYGTGGGMDCTGWRLFDVAINGRVVLDDLDVWKEAGHDRALKKVIPVTVDDGTIEISFPEVKSYQAVLSAIAIRKAG